MSTHYEKNKESIKRAAKKWLAEHQEVRMYNVAKLNAKNKGFEFTIELKDIRIPKVCPILNIPITNIMGKGRQESNASLDRIDSSRGYVKGNIWVISDLANRMKQNATRDQLISFAHGILSIYN